MQLRTANVDEGIFFRSMTFKYEVEAVHHLMKLKKLADF